MPFKLHLELPDGYATPYPNIQSLAGRGAQLDSINLIAEKEENNHYYQYELAKYTRSGGLMSVHELRTNWIAGYLIGERKESGDLDVTELRVVKEHQHKGIGGYLLGQFIENAPRISPPGPEVEFVVKNYGKQLTIGGDTYALPGISIDVSRGLLTETGFQNVLRRYRPRHWDGIYSETIDDQTSYQIIRGNKEITRASSRSDAESVILEGKTYDSIVMGAIHLLNADKLPK